jgi:hypothetical protein
MGLLSSETAAPAVYRPRHAERTAFYQLLEQHFDDYLYAYEERFEPKAGPLRPVVRPTVEAFLDCGRLHGGFARIRCPSCGSEHLLAFCQTRNFCSSCQAKRSVLFAEKLREQILQPVAHRHFVFTIPISAGFSSANAPCSPFSPKPLMRASERASSSFSSGKNRLKTRPSRLDSCPLPADPRPRPTLDQVLRRLCESNPKSSL